MDGNTLTQIKQISGFQIIIISNQTVFCVFPNLETKIQIF